MATAEQTSPLGERVSRIEGGYEHLATKADLARVETSLAEMRAELKADIARQDGQIRGIKWWILSVGAAIIALSSIIELLPLGG
ncbi:MAG: hypothetical protein OXK81_01495 [Chloroflexota bacterium]|nr:hypothetical protein [Chloroflexota bacterium]MDE2931343.1 hypothetical protein [Chloroflexota bacterium]